MLGCPGASRAVALRNAFPPLLPGVGPSFVFATLYSAYRKFKSAIRVSPRVLSWALTPHLQRDDLGVTWQGDAG